VEHTEERMVMNVIKVWFHDGVKNICSKLVESMQKHVQEVILAKGGHISYKNDVRELYLKVQNKRMSKIPSFFILSQLICTLLQLDKYNMVIPKDGFLPVS
jgi:hypothetical protein